MFNKKGFGSTLLGYLIAAVLMYFTGNAMLFDMSPFATGLYLALIFLGMNIYATSGIYIMASLMCDFSLNSFIGSAVVSVIIIGSKIIESKTKKKIRSGFMALPAVVSQFGYLYTMAAAGANSLNIFLSIFFALLFMYVNICFLRPILINKLKYRLLDYEIICGCIVMIILVLGLGSIHIEAFPIISALSLFFICFFAYAGGVRAALVAGICFGVGCALIDNDIAMMACFPFMAVLVAIFINSPRILGAAAGILGYVMFVFYFNTDYSNSLMFIIGMFIGGVIFCLIPRNSMERVRNFFSGSFTRTALRYVVNHNRTELGDALYKVSDIFFEMSGLMSGLKNEISDKNAEILYRSIVDDFCGTCVRKAICGSSREMKEGLDEVIKVSVAKGRASVIDLPLKVTESCLKIAQLIAYASDISTQYNRYVKTTENENAAKRIVSEQLLGISHILKDMGIKEAAPLSFDLSKERAIMEELTYRNIVCSEAMISVTERGGRATLIILTECVEKKTIEKTLAKVLGVGYNVTTIEDSIISGWSVVYAESSPKYDIVFGFASCPKTKGESSGDTHSFIKIHNNKFMMALCDGMGSGERAKQFSDVTISLIENFYKAGFEHSLVLESVNKFLSLSSDETFSAVDVCVVDLETAEVDVIKIGSPASYIKNSETVLKVDGSALPIGMLEEMRPSVSTQRLEGGDMVVLTTDGVSDSFSGDELAALINNLGGKNPQQLCAKIAETILQRSDPRDDMTVAAFRIFKRVS